MRPVVQTLRATWRRARRTPGLRALCAFSAFLLAATVLTAGPALAATAPGTTINNKALVVYSSAGINALSATSNNVSITVSAAPAPAPVPPTATIGFSQSATAACPGGGVRVTVTATNTGTVNLNGAVLTITLPAGAIVQFDAGIAVQRSGEQYSVSLPAVAPAGTATVGFTITLPASASGTSPSVLASLAADGVTLSTAVLPLSAKAQAPTVMEFLRYDAANSAPAVQVPATDYDTTGSGAFAALAPPTLAGGAGTLATRPVPLVATAVFHKGEVVFIRVSSPEANRDGNAVDTLVVRVRDSSLGDEEILRLRETGANTGVFLGYIATTSLAKEAQDGRLSVGDGSTISAQLMDAADCNAVPGAVAAIDPYGRVFDSRTGQPLSGLTVTLLNADSGQPATVYGDDGVSAFPAQVVTGSTVSDSGGASYALPAGGYRFPNILPGNYRLRVSVPTGAGYRWPSTATGNDIQSLPGAPYAIGAGARGEVFAFNAGQVFRVDIPADPFGSPLFVSKTANKTEVAAGDFVRYSVEVQNVRTMSTVSAVTVTDVLPPAFRYRSGSLRVNDQPAADPVLAADGRTMTVAIGSVEPGATVRLGYVLQAGAVTMGDATNSASARGGGGETSNIAQVTIKVKEDLMRSRGVLVGSVTLTHAGAGDEAVMSQGSRGLAGVRVFLENGSFAITDRNGRFHFEGVRPGTHVVQLDVATLPPQFEAVPTEKNTAFAGRPWSQFVELQGGSLWRADFHVAPKSRPQGSLGVNMTGAPAGDGVRYRVLLENRAVPLGNLRLTVMLPAGARHVPGSSALNGAALADPRETEGALTYALADVTGDWNGELAFTARIGDSAPADVLTAQAVLTFDTPVASAQRSPVVKSVVRRGAAVANDAASAGKPGESASASVKTAGLRPGEIRPLEETKSNAPEADGMPAIDLQWVEAAQPGTEWIWPKEGHLPPIPSLHVAIKHAAADKVTLLLEGEPVSPLNFDGIGRNKAKTVAVSLWRGINLVEGDNRFEVVITAPDGKETARIKRTFHHSRPPVRAEFLADQSVLNADGVNPPVIAVKLTDADGYPAREGVAGEFNVDAPYEPLKLTDFATNLMPGAPAEKARYVVGKGGVALIRLQPTNAAGEVRVTLPLSREPVKVTARLKPVAREWILVGLAEGTVGYNRISKGIEPLQGTAPDEHLYEDGRIAFFAKGQVKGEWLATVAYDSRKETQGAADPSLFQAVVPGTYYTLYGDTSRQGYEAASGKKLYLRIERDTFYALFGDFNTDFTVTTLARYSRSLTGFKSEYRGDTVQVKAFASDTHQAFAKDELRGQGVTGLYYLSRKNIVLNAEKITIEVRDRFRSEVIVSSQSLSRDRHYSIDYAAGTLLFRDPVPSTDENFNPVYIVVDYESFDSANHAMTYGARAEAKVGKDLQVGVTGIHEGQAGKEGHLVGVDARYQFGEQTLAKVEYAQSTNQAATGNGKDDAYLVEVEHKSKDLNGKVYARDVGAGFGLGQGNGTEQGTRKVGAEGTYRMSEVLALRAQAYEQSVSATGAKRTLVEALSDVKFGKSAIQLGVRAADDVLGTGEHQKSDQAILGYRQEVLDGKVTLRANREQTFGSGTGSVDFPTRTRLGADYLVGKATKFFAEHEWTEADARDTRSTRVGVKTVPWENSEAFMTLNQAKSEEGQSAGANFGLRQKWQITKQWSADAGFEHGAAVNHAPVSPLNPNVPLASAGTENFNATSAGLTYNPGSWMWTSRVEARNGESGNKWGVMSSVQTSPTEDLGLLASLLATSTKAAAGDETLASTVRLGAAYRPNDSRWTVLDKLDLITERKSGGVVPGSESQRLVNNLNANYKSGGKWQLSVQYGSKWVREQIDSGSYRGYTDLTGAEWRYYLGPEWDVGVHADVLHIRALRQFDYSYGVSVGHAFMTNVWVSVGFNAAGFEDRDFSMAGHTARGVFLRVRMKLDQQNVLQLLNNAGH